MVAQTAAENDADRAADRKVKQLLREWGLSSEGENGEEIARGYERE
jgi:hypothetical protein